MSKSNYLENLISKNDKIIIGLNSGTSADGVDAALIRIKGSGYRSNVKYLAGRTYRFPRKLELEIKKNAEPDFKDGESWLRLDSKLAKQFASAVEKLIRHAGLTKNDIDLIGSHGQTIRHLPNTPQGSITYQLADPARIAVLTGITTIGDFRVADIAAGGEGAPLTPIVNAILFKGIAPRTGVLNIGGIANITQIRSANRVITLFGCDTGPGNMVSDYLASKLFKLKFDKAGRLASKGLINKAVIKKLLQKRFFSLKGPKSTGREQFGMTFCERFLDDCRKNRLNSYDIMATAAELTCAAIKKCLEINKLEFDKLILTGGGSFNLFMFKRLKELLPQTEIMRSTVYGFPEEYLEAVSFAILANEALCSNRYDLRNITGARKPAVLGKICQA